MVKDPIYLTSESYANEPKRDENSSLDFFFFFFLLDASMGTEPRLTACDVDSVVVAITRDFSLPLRWILTPLSLFVCFASQVLWAGVPTLVVGGARIGSFSGRGRRSSIILLARAITTSSMRPSVAC